MDAARRATGKDQRLSRALVLAAVAAVVALLVATAAASAVTRLHPTHEIVIGQSIGSVGVGETTVELRRTVGKPWLSSPSHGGGFAQWAYGSNADLLAIEFSAQQAVIITAQYSKRFKTNKGVGIGSTWEQVHKAYPEAWCSKAELDETKNPHYGTPDPRYGSPSCLFQTKRKGKTVDTQFLTNALPGQPLLITMVVAGFASDMR